MEKRELLERTQLMASCELLTKRLEKENPGEGYYSLHQIMKTVRKEVERLKPIEKMFLFVFEQGIEIIYPNCTECVIDSALKKDSYKIEIKIGDEITEIELTAGDVIPYLMKPEDYENEDERREAIEIYEQAEPTFVEISYKLIRLRNSLIEIFEAFNLFDFSRELFREKENIIFDISLEERTIVAKYSIGDFTGEYDVLEKKFKCTNENKKVKKLFESQLKKVFENIYLHRIWIPEVILKLLENSEEDD